MKNTSRIHWAGTANLHWCRKKYKLYMFLLSIIMLQNWNLHVFHRILSRQIEIIKKG